MHARILDRDQLRKTTSLAEIKEAIAAKKPIWVELDGPSDDSNALLATLNIHPLTVEDIWANRSMPKVEDYDNYLYVIIHGVRDAKHGAFGLIELDVVIGDCFVLTHDPTEELTREVREELDRSPRLLAKGPAWLAHSLLDHAVDKYLPVVDQLDHELASLEDETLKRAGTRRGPPVLRRILRFKRMLLELRRMSIHQREILLRLARAEFDEIPKEVVPFFRDVYDHFLRINDQVDGYRDVVSGTLEAYLSVQSNRMNEIMKTLTVISTVMLPITFIAGVYGMNFQHMPELTWRYGYPYALGLMGLVTLGTLWGFKRRGWIGAREPELPEDSPKAVPRGSPKASADDSATDLPELTPAFGPLKSCRPGEVASLSTFRMRRLAIVLGILAATATAQARTTTGWNKGEKTTIKIVSCGNSEAEQHTAIAFRAMARAAEKAGLDLRIRSGFRSHAKQKQLYKEYQHGQGHLAARPGFSNHESGRALDIYITDYRVLEWLQKHGSEFGFHRTVPGEAWHWEYLGGYEPKAQRVARTSSKRTS